MNKLAMPVFHHNITFKNCCCHWQPTPSSTPFFGSDYKWMQQRFQSIFKKWKQNDIAMISNLCQLFCCCWFILPMTSRMMKMINHLQEFLLLWIDCFPYVQVNHCCSKRKQIKPGKIPACGCYSCAFQDYFQMDLNTIYTTIIEFTRIITSSEELLQDFW